jgi:hypothetical protein
MMARFHNDSTMALQKRIPPSPEPHLCLGNDRCCKSDPPPEGACAIASSSYAQTKDILPALDRIEIASEQAPGEFIVSEF